jgi:hypothetical protein
MNLENFVHRFIVPFIGTIFVLLASAVFAQESVEIIERKCIESRLAIKTYHIKVERDIHDVNDKSRVRNIGFEYYYDTQNKRCDTAFEWTNPKLQSEPGRYTQMEVWNEDEKKRYFWFSGISEDGLPSALQIYSIDDTTDREAAMRNFVDFRIIGFTPQGFTLQVSFDDIVSSPVRRNVTMADVQFKGMDCKKISFVHAVSGSKGCFWIVPDKGYNILRFECEREDISWKGWTELEIKQDASTGIWFPESSRMEQYKNGQLTVKEDLKINVISLNKKIDPAYFTPQKMNVTVGASVFIPPLTDTINLFWDGEKIIDESESEFLFKIEKKSLLWNYTLVAAGLLLIGITLFLLYMKTDKTK